MASISAGRTYLLQHPAAVDHLVSVLREQDSDTIARQNALGTLQKFSLRHKPQTAMIKLDLVKWIASILRAHCRAEADGETEAKGGNGILTEYTVEYATALLMNLSVRTIGKIKAEDEEVGILEVMNELLESENTQVRTYVNGTLYSVLTRPVLKERALEMGMDEMLKSLMEHSPEEFKNQIVFILEQLLKEDDATEEASDGEDVADDDVDDDEDEDDEEEEEEDDTEESLTPPEAGSKEASGQQLLEAQYASAEKTGFLGGSSPSHGRSPPAGSAAVAGQYQRPPVGHEQQGHAGAAAAKTGDPYESKIEDVDSGNMEARQDQDASAEEGGSTAMLDRTMKKRNENLAEELMSRPRIPRTPQTDSLGIMDPGEFGKAQANMGQSDPRAQAASGVSGEGLRYHKPVDDGYSKAFGDRPNLVRTPLVSASDLVAEPNEFGHYAGSKSEY